MQFVRFNSALPTLANHLFGRELEIPTTQHNSLPAVNISESETAYLLELAAPGLNKEDFKLNVQANRLVISAKKEAVKEQEEKAENSVKYTRKEFSFTDFQRAFTLPKNVDVSKVEATYTNGILTVSVPKKEEEKVKSFEIAVA
ncbi:MAG: Hsp20/alpha crystallin family protein [Flectobacillus sp.]|nr:Hsp20/alpha crystallin family protein [Flectobacillus sp.]